MEFIIAALFVLDLIIFLYVRDLKQDLKILEYSNESFQGWTRAFKSAISFRFKEFEKLVLERTESGLAYDKKMVSQLEDLKGLTKEWFVDYKEETNTTLNVHSDLIKHQGFDITNLRNELFKITKPKKQIKKAKR